MFTTRTVKKALKVQGFNSYEMQHFINLLKEIKNDRKNNKPSAK